MRQPALYIFLSLCVFWAFTACGDDSPVQCSELDCISEHRTCVDATADEDAYCGTCDEGHWDNGEICTPISVCDADQYEVMAPTETTDRICKDLTVCANDQYEAAAPTTTSDRECSAFTVCGLDEIETTSPTSTSDRVCTPLDDCDTYTGGVTITDGEGWPEHPSGCLIIEGDLRIMGDEASPVNLIRVTGNLRILYYNAESLEVVSQLREVEESLYIQYTAALTSIQGLESLTTVGRDLYIEDNAALTSLQGLESLTTVGRDIYIEDNATLTSLQGQESLTTVGRDIYIRTNSGLTSLQGLESLTTVGRDLYIEDNAALTSLQGLENLTTVDARIRIAFNHSLCNQAALNFAYAINKPTTHITQNKMDC